MTPIRARKWQTCFLGVIITLALGVFQANAAGGEPILTIPASSYDAGVHPEGERVSHAFEVENKGSADLRIQRVKPG